MDKIAHLTVKYLNNSETFICKRVRQMKACKPVVLNLSKETIETAVVGLFSSAYPTIIKTIKSLAK
jgi:hypothetical protein